MVEEVHAPPEIGIKTGPVRASGYAIKLRRVINAALKDYYKSKLVNTKKVNEYVTNLNKTLYEILIERLEAPKDLVIDVTGKVNIVEDAIVIKDIEITIWDKDELLSKTVTKELREKMEKLVQK